MNLLAPSQVNNLKVIYFKSPIREYISTENTMCKLFAMYLHPFSCQTKPPSCASNIYDGHVLCIMMDRMDVTAAACSAV